MFTVPGETRSKALRDCNSSGGIQSTRGEVMITQSVINAHQHSDGPTAAVLKGWVCSTIRCITSPGKQYSHSFRIPSWMMMMMSFHSYLQTPSVLSAVRVHATWRVSMMTCTVSRSNFCRNTVMTTPISRSRLIRIFLYSVISPCCPERAISAAGTGWKRETETFIHC